MTRCFMIIAHDELSRYGIIYPAKLSLALMFDILFEVPRAVFFMSIFVEVLCF